MGLTVDLGNLKCVSEEKAKIYLKVKTSCCMGILYLQKEEVSKN